MPALSKATRGNVKEDDKKIAMVLAESLREEEEKKELTVRSCQEEERLFAEAVKLSLEESSGDKNLPPVISKTGFFDRPDNYIMVDGVRHLSSASYILPNNPRGPSPFQPWLMTPQGLKPVTYISLGPLNPGACTLETKKTKTPKPSLNWGQGLLINSQQQTNLTPLTSVVSTEQPVEFPNSTKAECIDGVVTEVPSALPQSDEPVVAASEETISSIPKVEGGAQDDSTPEVESGLRDAEFAPSSSGITDGLEGSSPIDGDLRSSGSEVNSLRGSIDSEVVGSNNGVRSEKADSDSDNDVRKVCGMNEPDIKLETSDPSSSSNNSSRSSNSASSSDGTKPLVISQAAITKLLLESSSWLDEDAVLLSMKSAGLNDFSGPRAKPVAILPKTLAGLIFKSKATFYDKQQVALARIKNEEAAEENYNKRLGKLYVEHSRKTNLAEQELSEKIKRVDQLKDTLEKRLEASRILEEESVGFGNQQKELADQNEQLRRDVTRLREKLRAISNGTVELSNSTAGTAGSARGHDSSASSHSFASSLQSIPSNDAKKRDRSPNATLRANRVDGIKKSRSHREIIDDWNKEGIRAVHGFCENKRSHMKTQHETVLETWRTSLEQAISNFRVQFNMDGHLSDTLMTTQEKDNFSHSEFAGLQREFGIPTVEDGRPVSVHFYYGQLLNVINNVLTSRRTFITTARDQEKLDAYIKHRCASDPADLYVANYREAQNNLRDIEKDARHMHDFFLDRMRLMEVPGASRDVWISEASYLELQSLARVNPKVRRLALGAIIGQSKSQFTQYHKLKSQHVVIDFYSDARTHFRNTLKEQPNFKHHGGRPQRQR